MQAFYPISPMSSAADFGPIAESPMIASGDNAAVRVLGRGLLVLLMLLLGLAWLVAVDRPYEPGSDLGYNLGLVGGLLMVSLLFYSLRKRLRPMERTGSMSAWFHYHMVIGIAGPVLVLFHSTFQAHSMNGSVALYAMLAAALSGVVGRFVYRHIHYGMYGAKVSIKDAQQCLKESGRHIETLFSADSEVPARLAGFEHYAFGTLPSAPHRLWRFVTLRWQGRRLAAAVRQDIKHVMRASARELGWSKQELARHYGRVRIELDDYVDAVCRAAQLSTWERLFSLWHLVHVPFLYLLVLTGIVHVVAVHMY